MPGPVSDSYDPEFGTSAVAGEIDGALEEVYDKLTGILGGRPPMPIIELVRSSGLNKPISATLCERDWRMIRFALERARDSI